MADKTIKRLRSRPKHTHGRSQSGGMPFGRNTPSILADIDPSTLSAEGKRLYYKAIRENQPIHQAATPRPGDARNTAVSLARGSLPRGSLLSNIIAGLTKGGGQGLTRSAAARAAGARGRTAPPTPEMLRKIEEMVFRQTVARRAATEGPMDTSIGAAVRDVARSPYANWLQGSAAETVWQMKSAMRDLNNKRTASGERQIDFPGRRGLFPDGLRIGTPPAGTRSPKVSPDPKIRTRVRGNNFVPTVKLDSTRVTDWRKPNRDPKPRNPVAVAARGRSK